MKYDLTIDLKELFRQIKDCYGSRQGESHAINAINFLCEEVERLRAILKEADEYLNTNKLTNIAHKSILHREFKDA